MKEFFADKVRSEEGAETVEIIIGIVVFVVFGIAVFGMITNVAGNKMQDISRCLGDSSTIITKAGSNDASKTCQDESENGGGRYGAGLKAGNEANYNSKSTPK